MDKHNQEAIKFLFETYSPITDRKIKSALGEDYSTHMFNRGNDSFDELSLKKYMMSAYNLFFYQKHEAEDISQRVNKLSQTVLDVYRDLQIRLDDAISASRGAALADKSNPGIVKTVYYSPSSGYNPNNTSAKIEGGKVIGQSIQESIISDNTSYSKMYKSGVSAVLSESNNIFQCIIKDSENAPVSDDYPLVNGGSSFIVDGESPTPGEKEIEVIIDRQEYIKFNNISIVTPVSYIYTVYKSEDGIYFTKINNSKILTSELNLSLEATTARYIKVVVHFSKHTLSGASGYIYRYEVSSMLVKMTQYKDKAIFETGEIDINAIGEYLAIDTCDNYQDRNIYLGYQINIDDKGWKSIKPVRKASIYQNGLRSIVPISDYQDMKVGVLTEYETSGRRNIFSADIENTLVNSNSFRYFDRSSVFRVFGNYMSTTGILYEDKEYDFGNLMVMLNGSPVQGKVTLFSGVNTIEFPASSFKELFNINNLEDLLILENGSYRATFKDDEQVYTFGDSDFRINGFSITLSIFGFKALLGKEITEEVELINTDETFKVSAPSEVSRIYILMRSRLAKVNNVKLRLTMQSMDTYTRPEMTRVIFRVA